jgi:hypothetical protein
MAERSRPALDGPGGSPVPEGYGSLDDAVPGTGAPPRPRRPSRRLPQARATVAADARQAETRAETRAAEEEERAAEASGAEARTVKSRAAEARTVKSRAAEARGSEAEAAAEGEAADAQAAGRILAEQQAAEAQLAARRSEGQAIDTRQRDVAAAAGAADPTLSAVQEAGPQTPARVQEAPSRASDAQAAEQWAEQRREAVQESRRAAADLQGGRPGPSGAATTIGLPVVAPVPAAAMTATAAARRELWEEEDDGAARSLRRRKVRIVRSTSSRRLVRRIDTWTVFKVSFVFYVLALIILVVAGIILWNVAEAFGTITSIQKSAKSLFDLSHFVIKPIPLLEYTAGGGAILCILGTVVNTVVALLYNLISDVVGGVQVVVVAEPD